jgi:hypothetical protein
MTGARVLSFLLLLVLLSCGQAAAADALVLWPSDTGTVTYSAAQGVIDDTDDRLVSSCAVTSSGPAFSRGYAEFDLSQVAFEIESATLTVRETLDVGEFASPVALHELALYEADLVVGAADLEMPATPAASFMTDDADPGRWFEVDVTAAVRAMRGRGLGVRLKLVADPAAACEPQGAAFDGLLQPSPPLLTIMPVVAIPVSLDVAPGVCPNPFNLLDNKLAAAISGSDVLDVRSIDVSSVRLMGVPPIRAQIKDVSTPSNPYTYQPGACLDDGRDGVPDLLLVFDMQAIVRALDQGWDPCGLCEGRVMGLGVSGRMRPEEGGRAFAGRDLAVVHRGHQSGP